MTSKATVQDFLAQEKLAVLGVSRARNKFGNWVFRELRKKGYQVFPINPNVAEIEGERCFASLSALPAGVTGVVVVLPPQKTEQLISDIAAQGIYRVWLQQGSESAAAIAQCRQHGLAVVHGECILMFAEPVGLVHRVHRWLWRVLGKMPT